MIDAPDLPIHLVVFYVKKSMHNRASRTIKPEDLLMTRFPQKGCCGGAAWCGVMLNTSLHGWFLWRS